MTAEQKERVCLNIGAQPTVAGKGLSSNDYTDAEKTKLSSIESGAEANVKPDWSAEAGSDAEILNKPTIPTVDQTYDGTSTNAQSGVAVASAISGLSFDEVPPVTSSDDGKVLKATYGEGTGSYAWDDAPGLFEAVYGTTTYSEIAAAVAANKIAYCKVLTDASPSPQYRMAHLAYITPTVYEFQYYRSKVNKSANDQGDEIIVYKVDNENSWSTTSRKTYTKIAAGTNMSASYDSGTLTLNATMPTVDQTYDGTSTNAQSGTAVASALSGIADVPTVGSSDDGKVLKATYSGGAGSYSWDTDSGEANVIEAITVNSESTTISSKTVNIPAATASTGGVGGTSGVMTPSDKEKLDGLVSNVQADWNAASGSAAEILNKPTIPSVDQTYDSSSTNAQSGTAVASALSGIADVPTVGSSDDGKVLKASYSGGAGSYSWQPESGGGGTTYTAGNGIAIDQSNNISVKIPSSNSGLEFDGGVLDVKTSTANGIRKGASGLEVRLASSSGLELSSGLKVKTDGTSIQVNSSGELEAIGGGGGSTYTAGDGIDISAQDVISTKVDGTSITVNASHELTTSAQANVIEGVKLDGAASVLTPDASKNVTIPNAVATGETGATNGLMTADDKKALGTAVQYKVNPLESGTPVLLAQQMYVVESDAQIISIAGQSSEIQGKGTIFFRVGV